MLYMIRVLLKKNEVLFYDLHHHGLMHLKCPNSWAVLASVLYISFGNHSFFQHAVIILLVLILGSIITGLLVNLT
jgi:hypothetical protein